jgi:hypothetical protein
MDPEIAALLVTGATSLVKAAATKTGNGLWDLVRPKIAKLFGRGDATQEATALRRLDATAVALEQTTDDDRDQVRDLQQNAWQTRLADFLEEHPDAKAELKALLEELNKRLPATQTNYVQHNSSQSGGQTFGVQGPDSRIIVHQEPPASPA